MTDSKNGIVAIVHELRPRCYLISEAAAICGRSPDTLRRWRKEGVVEPSMYYDFGLTRVWLYSKDDLKKLKHTAKVTRSGRKKKNANA